MLWIKSEPLSIERITVAIADLPPALSGTKITQLSDLHYDGVRLSETLLAEAIAASNQEKPDLVLLTGDYITYETTPIHQLASYLKHLQSNAGIYACLGNHDLAYVNAKTIVTEALTRNKIQVLWNEIAYPLGKDLPLVGLADFWSGEFHPEPILSQINSQIPRIVLSHNPDTAKPLKKYRVDLQLSGHTHGGQAVIPGIGSVPTLFQQLQKITPTPLQPFIPFMKECTRVVNNWQWGQGFHRIGNNQLYVNRGLGTYFPGRFFCPPELTVITLVRQA